MLTMSNKIVKLKEMVDYSDIVDKIQELNESDDVCSFALLEFYRFGELTSSEHLRILVNAPSSFFHSVGIPALQDGLIKRAQVVLQRRETVDK